MKIIEAQWQEYRKRVMPPEVSVIQLDETRKAFYSGVAALFGVLTSTMSDGLEPTEDDMKIMDGIKSELDDYIKERQDEIRRSLPGQG